MEGGSCAPLRIPLLYQDPCMVWFKVWGLEFKLRVSGLGFRA